MGLNTFAGYFPHNPFTTTLVVAGFAAKCRIIRMINEIRQFGLKLARFYFKYLWLVFNLFYHNCAWCIYFGNGKLSTNK